MVRRTRLVVSLVVVKAGTGYTNTEPEVDRRPHAGSPGGAVVATGLVH
jgi:hypothetical protein